MLKKKYSLGTSLTLLTIAFLLQSQMMPRLAIAAGNAAVGAAGGEQLTAKHIGEMETRFFSRQYANDPIEKRLERLELLVFGGTQDGDNSERLARLKKSMAQRAAEGAKQGAAGGPAATSKGPTTSSQYPVLKTLEWRAFKKSFPAETLDQRLGRLEKKVFGAESPAMAYVDRVDRLKRTLGADSGPAAQRPVLTQQPPHRPLLGPMPKARPRGQGSPDLWSFSTPGFSGRGNMFDDDDSFGTMPGFGLSPGGGMALPNTISNMLREMDRQMAELEQLPSGAYTYDPSSGAWIERNTGKKIKPGLPHAMEQMRPQQLPTFKVPRLAPKVWQTPSDGAVPPYSDPNSI